MKKLTTANILQVRYFLKKFKEFIVNIYANLYNGSLNQFHQVRKRECPEKFSRSLFLLHDNARPHINFYITVQIYYHNFELFIQLF